MSERTRSQYEKILSREQGEAERELGKEVAKIIAFEKFLRRCYDTQRQTPNPYTGDLRISVVEYFRQAVGGNETSINQAALNLLPSYIPPTTSYGNSDDSSVSHLGMEQVYQAVHLTELEASERGSSMQRAIGNVLLIQPRVVDYRNKAESSVRFDHSTFDQEGWERIMYTGALVADIDADLADMLVLEAPEMRQLVQERGYKNFLDFLIDTKGLIDGRIETVFAHEANTPPAEPLYASGSELQSQ